MNQIPEEVKAGIALLDEKVPGWRERIDLNQLKMEYCFSCILGQVFGEYVFGLRQLGIATDDDSEFDPEEQAVNLGFQSNRRNGICLDYGYLNQAWKEALSEVDSPITV